MSADDSGGGPGRREIAWRVFAAEFDDATHSYSEGDRERAPNYVVTPTGGRVNRLFVVGVLTAVESVSDEVVRARVVDPTGAFVVYAGQYQPEPLAFLERTGQPAFVAVTGKARTFEPEDSDVVYTSIRPESVSEVDADARDRWAVSAAEQTLHRVSAFADAVDRPERGDDLEAVLSAAGLDDGLAAGIPRAIEQYGTTTGYLAAVRDLALDAARVVAGDLEEADPLSLAPDEGGDVALDLSYSVDLDGAGTAGDDPAGTGGADPAAEADGTGSEPAGTEAAGTEPAADEGAEEADRPAAPAGVEPSADEPGADEPSADEPSADEPGADEPSADEPGADEPDVGGVEATDDEASDPGMAEPIGDDAATGPAAGDDDGPAGMYELDDEERAELEAEYPTEFSSGSDIPDAGEADIETPSPDDGAASGDDRVADDAPAEDPATGGETADEEMATEPDSEPAEPPDELPADSVEPSDDGEAADDEPTDDEPTDDEPTDDEPTDDSGAPRDDSGATPEDTGDGDQVPDDLEDVVVEYMQELDDGDGADREALVAAVTGEYAVGDDDVEEAVRGALMSGRCFEPSDGIIKSI